MLYRELGKTGLKVSQLGFGAMRLPMTGPGADALVDCDRAIPMIHRAFEAGVNYIDTAVFYCNEDSQRAVGLALKGWREKIVVSTKNPYYGEDEKTWWTNLENSLQRLDIDCIDIYNHHGMNWKGYCESVEPRLGKWMARAKDQKMIRHICCSFHDNNDALKKIAASEYPEVITLQYNLLDRQLEEGIAFAREKGIGIVAMGPVGGGRLGDFSRVLSGVVAGIERLPELALRFVLANPNVSVALSGMGEMEQVEENIRVASKDLTLSGSDIALMEEHLARLKKMADLYCTGCNYCMSCPQEVAIPKIFERYNRGRVYDLWNSARSAYAAIGTNQWDTGKRADACVECGACEEKCPQHLPIRQQLKEAHEALTKTKDGR
ncbi:MAG: aldo/keto reductase [Candidatus Sumerlaeota bacterium]|nr:aldo/keto reductase [Candidatus Sumerlaeota bacterium]